MSEKISYSFNDKFFSLEKEKRIARRQFFSRLAVPGFILLIPNIVLSFLLLPYVIYVQVFFSLLYLLFIWIFLPKIVIKRCHDFDSEGIIEKNISLGVISIYVITGIIITLSILFIDTISLELIGLLGQGYSYLGRIVFFIIMYLFVRPGNKGKNNYGDDTNNVKLGLFG